MNRSAPSRPCSLDHPDVDVATRGSSDGTNGREIQTPYIGRDERIDVAVRSGKRRDDRSAPFPIGVLRHVDRRLPRERKKTNAIGEVFLFAVESEGDAPLLIGVRNHPG